MIFKRLALPQIILDLIGEKVGLKIEDEDTLCWAIEKLLYLHDNQKKSIKYLTEKMNQSWIPVSERVPEETEYIGLSNGQSYMKRLEIAYMTDTIEYAFGYYDGYKWMDKRHEKIINAVAWKRHEPYRPQI